MRQIKAKEEKTWKENNKFTATKKVAVKVGFVTLPSSHRPSHPSGQTPLFRVDFGVAFGRFRPFSANFGHKQPKSTRNRLLLKGLLRVLGRAAEGVCG